MVVVGVRDEHRVEIAQLIYVDRARAPEKCDPLSEQRVGEQPHSVEIDEDRRMTDVDDVAH